MCSADQNNASLCNGTTGQRLRLCANLVNNEDLRHVVLNCLDLHSTHNSPLHLSGTTVNTMRFVGFNPTTLQPDHGQAVTRRSIMLIVQVRGQ